MNTSSDGQRQPSDPQREIILADVAGFCFGVQRAVDIAEAARRERFGRLTTLGPIVHNEQVIRDLESRGIEAASNLEEIDSGTVILSAHGSSPDVAVRAARMGLGIIDVTCPFVTRAHRAALKLHREGYQVVLLGDSGHSEVRGVVGSVEAAGGVVTIVAHPAEADTVPVGRRVGVISQTTQRAADFAATVAALCRRAPDVRAINTICGATDELQEAARKLAAQCDVVLVIGGRKSANTRRLRELSEEAGTPAYQIETAADIDESWLAGKVRIGLTAGASTPDGGIEEVARHLNGGTLPDTWRLRHPDERLTARAGHVRNDGGTMIPND